jgi:CheY-like chemotaxis protein
MKSAKILFIDDEKSVREMSAKILALEGHQVTVASSGPEGLEALKEGGYDIVLVDFKMPGMSGLEVAKRVKEIDEGIAVVLVTGWMMEVDEEEAREQGVDSLLPKPFDFDDLCEAIERFLPKSL